ncbi:MAG TPA: hypothetical protein VF950_16195 [Planctomycetota bacterium]
MGGSVLALALLAAAQDPPLKQAGDTWIQAGDAIAWTRGDDTITFLTGLVTVKRTDFELHASRAVVWRVKGSKLPLDRLYAEGNVVFSRGKEKLRAERFYYDLKDSRAAIVELRGEGYSDDLKTGLYVAAALARMTGEGRLEAEHVSVTPCSFAVPHVHVEIARAELRGRNPRPRKEGEIDPFPFEKWDVDFDSIYTELGGAPFLFLPGLAFGSWMSDFPLRSIQYENSSRFGHSIFSEFGHRFRAADEEGKLRTVADLRAEADWREKRGWAGGLDLEYGWRPGGYSGFVDSYFLYDQGRDLDVAFELKFPPLEQEERGKVHAFHRHDVHESWRYELEAYYLSDRSLREEFFEKEFKENKDPETAAYLRWLDGPVGAYLLERHRLNDFQTQNEYLPRLDLWLQPYPVLGPEVDVLFVAQRLDVAHVRRRWDEDLHLSSVETWRIDSTSEVWLPLDLGIFTLAPFGQYRATAYEDDLEGETETRSIWTAGARAVANLHGTFPEAALPGLGLRGLRHVAELEIRFASVLDAREADADLFAFEEVDQLDEFEEISLELRQRFLTKDEKGKPFEFLSAVAEIEYYPDSDRDTRAPFVSNFEEPFHWIGLAPSGTPVGFERRHWSNLHYAVEFRPKTFFSFVGAGEWNPVTKHEEAREMTATLRPVDGIALGAGHMFVRGVTDAWSGQVAWAMTPKWSVGAAVQYDFRTDEVISENLVLSRDLHDFLLQLVVERDFGRDDDRVYFAIVPKFLSLGSKFKSAIPTAP